MIDGQTDRQTELPWHICTIAYMLSRVKSKKKHLSHEKNISHMAGSGMCQVMNCKVGTMESLKDDGRS